MPLELLNVDTISCSYNGMTVLRDVSFRVQRGDYLGIVGPNGSGKSTLIRAILGLSGMDTGKIHLFGSDLPIVRMRMRRIQALRIGERKGLHVRGRLCKQATGGQHGQGAATAHSQHAA